MFSPTYRNFHCTPLSIKRPLVKYLHNENDEWEGIAALVGAVESAYQMYEELLNGSPDNFSNYKN